jgi:hypothetical protein
MNTQRILKEARPLFLPWCAVALAGALPLVYPFDVRALIILIGFLVVPLMATLSLGDEFQHRTFSLLLSQPVGRMKIWGEKMSVTVVAIVSAILVFFLALRATSIHPGRLELAFAGAWIVAIIASATFWTLFTRSTVGGVALNIGIQSFISFTIPWTKLTDGLRARGYLAPGSHLVPSAVAIVFLCYAGVMVWLGGRKLARFQATGGMASDDLLMAGPDVMPGALADWFRSRPSGVVLNLIRKELRLLRPVWLISLLAAAGWACLTLLGLLFERGYSRNFETAVIIVGVISTLMIAILAGSMSLGEERTSGTHAWHLTLPVSSPLQWLIKLAVALFASFVGAWLLPALIAGRLFGSTHILADQHFGIRWLLLVLLLTFAAFWCACALNVTVGAVLWVIPVMIAVVLTGIFGGWVAQKLVDLFLPSFDPLAYRGLAIALHKIWWSWRVGGHADLVSTVLLAPALLFAIVQSYRMFRAQPQNSTFSLVRSVWPLAMMVFLWTFSLGAFNTFVDNAAWQVWGLVLETNHAIEKSLPSATNSDAMHPLQLTVDDLAKVDPRPYYPFPLSESTRRLLRSSRITVIPDKAHPRGFYCREHSTGIKWTTCYYIAAIHLADGTDLFESNEPSTDPNYPYGHWSVYIQWPGAKAKELIWGR